MVAREFRWFDAGCGSEEAECLGASRYVRECAGMVCGLVRPLSYRTGERSGRPLSYWTGERSGRPRFALQSCSARRLLGGPRRYIPLPLPAPTARRRARVPGRTRRRVPLRGTQRLLFPSVSLPPQRVSLLQDSLMLAVCSSCLLHLSGRPGTGSSERVSVRDGSILGYATTITTAGCVPRACAGNSRRWRRTGPALRPWARRDPAGTADRERACTDSQRAPGRAWMLLRFHREG